MRLKLLLAVASASMLPGCSVFRPQSPPLPAVLSPTPMLDQMIYAVNNNAAQIRSFATSEAELSGPGIPALRGTTIAFERPRRLRLRAGTTVTGPELDVGSNDELFWIWIRRNEPPALLFCRHAQFATSPVRRMLPIDPDWLLESFGLTEFDPVSQHQGPYVLSDGRLEIRSVRQTPDGPAMKITRVEALSGAVLEQYTYDAQGQLVAGAVASQHRRDPLSGLILPRIVDIQVPRSQFKLRVNLGNATINAPIANGAELWTMPAYEGWPTVDLCDPRLQFQPGAPPASAGPVPPVSHRAQRVNPGWR